jgi:SAM-dependent methyltransferase
LAFYSKFAQYYQHIFPFKKPVYEFLRSYCKQGEGGVLDVGCGPGHYAAQFADDGYDAVAIDLDPGMIRFAQNRHPNAQFYVMNMMDIDRIGSRFEMIYCIGNTLAHLTAGEVEQFLQKVYGSLNKGGTWIFQVRNWDFVTKLREYQFPVLQSDKGDIRFFRTYTDITDKSLVFNTKLTLKQETVFEDRVSLYPVATEEYLEYHNKAGFTRLGHYADFQGTPFIGSKDTSHVFVFTL